MKPHYRWDWLKNLWQLTNWRMYVPKKFPHELKPQERR